MGGDRGAPIDVQEDIFDVEIAANGAIYVIFGSGYGGVKQMAYRGPAGNWSESTPLPVDVLEEGTAVDSFGRLHVVSRGGGRYLIWTPGRRTPVALDVNGAYAGHRRLRPAAHHRPRPHPAPNEWFYFGPAVAAAATSTLWQQVTIPADMPAPNAGLHAAAAARRVARRPEWLRAFVEDGGRDHAAGCGRRRPGVVAGLGRFIPLAGPDG